MNTNLNIDSKLPPQAIDLEEAVIGACLIDSDSIYKISHILNPINFYKDSNQKIFHAIQELINNNQKLDILTITEKLKALKQLDEIGGVHHIITLSHKVATSSHIEYHAAIVKQKYIAREFIRFSSELQSKAYDDEIDVSDLIDFAQNQLMNIVENTITQEAEKLDGLMKSEVEAIEQMTVNKIELNGIPSGFSKIDRIIGGWQPSDFILLAARPSHGKTAEAIYFSLYASLSGFPVALFSLEMSKRQLTKRIICYDTKIDSMRLNKGIIYENEWSKLDGSLHKHSKTPLYIDDKSSLSILEFKSKAKLYVMKYGIKLILIDYLQLMKGYEYGNRDQEIGTITRGLKATAKDLDIPIIALAQLSRDLEKRGDKRPKLSDLRESGNMEQDADIVICLHRPEKFGEKEIFTNTGNIDTSGLIINIIEKHRNGALGDVFLWDDDGSFNNLREFKSLNDFDMDKHIESKF